MMIKIRVVIFSCESVASLLDRLFSVTKLVENMAQLYVWDLELKDQGQSLSPEPLWHLQRHRFSSGGFLDDDKNKGCHL